jgi:hypothetical protein
MARNRRLRDAECIRERLDVSRPRQGEAHDLEAVGIPQRFECLMHTRSIRAGRTRRKTTPSRARGSGGGTSAPVARRTAFTAFVAP